ncbi:selenium cofactor biosynthesis protein YqeC [Anoxynatronum sibiricum]|uniref:Selenium cofactor biosynthesis protein YqeC n=1 Tax=Anoxynatronum sibiricum TaxID=210623 RepID=A0ABU9VPW4_9CLOT
MALRDLFNLQRADIPVISFVGAGGKTTAMFTLAAELRAAGNAVMVTTTTAMYVPKREPVDHQWTHPTLLPHCFPAKRENGTVHPQILVWGSGIQRGDSGGDKLTGISLDAVSRWKEDHSGVPLLVEADGSRKRPVKAPADHEPVIPVSTKMVIGVIGLKAMGAPVNVENVHRLDPFCRVTESQPGDRISVDHLRRLIFHEKGLFKDAPPAAAKIVLLNQADTAQQRLTAVKLAEQVMKSDSGVQGVVTTQLHPTEYRLLWGERR